MFKFLLYLLNFKIFLIFSFKNDLNCKKINNLENENGKYNPYSPSCKNEYGYNLKDLMYDFAANFETLV